LILPLARADDAALGIAAKLLEPLQRLAGLALRRRRQFVSASASSAEPRNQVGLLLLDCVEFAFHLLAERAQSLPDSLHLARSCLDLLLAVLQLLCPALQLGVALLELRIGRVLLALEFAAHVVDLGLRLGHPPRLLINIAALIRKNLLLLRKIVA